MLLQRSMVHHPCPLPLGFQLQVLQPIVDTFIEASSRLRRRHQILLQQDRAIAWTTIVITTKRILQKLSQEKVVHGSWGRICPVLPEDVEVLQLPCILSVTMKMILLFRHQTIFQLQAKMEVAKMATKRGSKMQILFLWQVALNLAIGNQTEQRKDKHGEERLNFLLILTLCLSWVERRTEFWFSFFKVC